MNKKNRIIIFVIAIAFFIFFLYTNNIITGLKSDLDDYKDALAEANKSIDRANSIIEDAQDEAWSSYQEMGEALENLETVKNVSDPSMGGFLSLPKLKKLPGLK